MVPNSTTRAMAVATSSSLALATPSMPATAAAPQMENPEAISNRWAGEIPSRVPIHSVPKNVTATDATTTAKTPKPRSSTEVRDTCSPSSTIPVRSSLLAEIATPGASTAGTGARFRHSAPARIATSRGLTPGTSWASPQASPAPARQTARPGRAGVGNRRRPRRVSCRSAGVEPRSPPAPGVGGGATERVPALSGKGTLRRFQHRRTGSSPRLTNTAI